MGCVAKDCKKNSYYISMRIKTLNQRNVGIDIARFAMSFLIVCIHVPPNGIFGKAFLTITRIAVPFFFMTSGYFLGNLSSNCLKVKKQANRVFKMAIISSGLYFIWYASLSVYQHTGLKNYIQRTLTVEALYKWVLFNEDPFAFHLWFLWALLYTLIFAYFLSRMKNYHKFYWLIVPFLLYDLCFGKYSLLLWGREFDVYIVRNYVGVGIPYFLLGNLISNSPLTQKISKKVNILHIAIFVFASVIEMLLLSSVGKNATRDHYLSTTFLVLSVFYYVLKERKNWSEKAKTIARWGKKYTFMIYIVQVMVINTMTSVVNKINLVKVMWPYMSQVAIFLLSFMISVIIFKIKNKLKVNKKG